MKISDGYSKLTTFSFEYPSRNFRDVPAPAPTSGAVAMCPLWALWPAVARGHGGGHTLPMASPCRTEMGELCAAYEKVPSGIETYPTATPTQDSLTVD